MRAVIFILYCILEYLLVTAFFLRLLLPLIRANMRNPLSQAVLRATSPVIMPLRRFLPPIGRIDTASVLALLVLQLAIIALLSLIAGYPLEINFLLTQSALALADVILRFYGFALFIYVVIGWIAPQTYSPAGDLLSSICEVILRPVRRFIPPLAGLDFSVFFVLIVIAAILISLPPAVFPVIPYAR